MPDVISRIMTLVRERANVQRPELDQIEREARMMLAGDRYRISERPRGVVSIEDVDQRLRQRKSVSEVASEIGVARSTIYRLLQRRGKVAERPAAQHLD